MSVPEGAVSQLVCHAGVVSRKWALQCAVAQFRGVNVRLEPESLTRDLSY